MTDLRIVKDGLFETVQGEGFLAGTPSLFLRTAGCNLRCAWCDTPESLPDYDLRLRVFQPKPTFNAIEVDTEMLSLAIEASIGRGFHHVVVTGGEPTLQQGALLRLFGPLRKHGHMHVTMETNCEVPPSPELRQVVDLASLSPKLHRWKTTQGAERIVSAYEEWAAIQHVQLKVVAGSIEEVRNAVELIRALRKVGRIKPIWAAVQLEDSWVEKGAFFDADEEVVRSISSYLGRHNIRLVVQQHKVMRIL